MKIRGGIWMVVGSVVAAGLVGALVAVIVYVNCALYVPAAVSWLLIVGAGEITVRSAEDVLIEVPALVTMQRYCLPLRSGVVPVIESVAVVTPE